MWFVFILIPMATAATAAVYKTTGGPKLVSAGVALMAWQRHKGHRVGEGQLTDRVNNNTYYGIEIDIESTYDTNHMLGVISMMAEKDFAPYVGKKFDMTVSEGNLLKTMTIPAFRAAEDVRGMWQVVRDNPDNPEVVQAFKECRQQFRSLIKPVLLYLKQFPDKRVRHGQLRAQAS